MHGRLVVGDQEVRIDPEVLGNEGVLRCYLSMVRFERGLGPEAPVTLRLDDLEVLAIALDVTDRQLETCSCRWPASRSGAPPTSVVASCAGAPRLA